MNKGNKTVGALLTLFLILDLFASILLKKVTSSQKFLPFWRFFTVFTFYCTLPFSMQNAKFLTYSDFFRQNGENEVRNQKNGL